MGNIKSAYTEADDAPERDVWWDNDRMTFHKKCNATVESTQQNTKTSQHQNKLALEFKSTSNSEPSSRALSESNKEKLNDFKLELARKHEKRREILAEKRKEMEDLREEIQRLKTENETLKKTHNPNETTEEIVRLKQENDALRKDLQEKVESLKETENLHTKNIELRKDITLMQCELQSLNKDILEFEKEKHDYQAHVVALKDVIRVSKQMLQIKESQLQKLKQKVEEIEASLQDWQTNTLSQDLRNEYERQLQNIRNLRALYEERQRTDRREKQELSDKIEDLKKELETSDKKNEELKERVTELEEENSTKYDEIMSLKSNFGLAKAETRQYQAELTVINQLFSEVLLGFTNSPEIDLDRLTKHLEDHHDLLKNIVINEISPEVASVLPKVLLELVSQVNNGEEAKEEIQIIEQAGTPHDNSQKLETIIEESESQTSTCQLNSPAEIVELLPKVWRVLIELLSHQKAPASNLIEEPNETTKDRDPNPCYKTVQTPKGPSLVLSVSQTFIRLKDLILEKRSLEKETNNLKQLNTHLETRLQDQEKRLGLVSSELSKTWHVVGKLQKQHQLLHTQEKILRYELAQKRKLLTTLKEELEYSREKRQQAREKNSNTEKQWRQLRVEFASRRNLVSDDLNNSTESGYSDERASSSDDEADGPDEPGYETDISECTSQQQHSDYNTRDNQQQSEATPEQLDVINTTVCLESNINNQVTLEDNEESNDLIMAENNNVHNNVQDLQVLDSEEPEEGTDKKDCVKSTNIFTDEASCSTTIQNVYETNEKAADLNKDQRDSSSQASSTLQISELTKPIEDKSSDTTREHSSTTYEATGLDETVTSDATNSTKEYATPSSSNELVLQCLEHDNSNQATSQNDISIAEELLEKRPPRKIVDHLGNLSSYIDSLDSSATDNAQPSTSSGSSNAPKQKMTFEEHLAAKEERLKRLEGQCTQLVKTVTNTSNKRLTISNRLDSLHEIYGENSQNNQSSNADDDEEEESENNDQS